MKSLPRDEVCKAHVWYRISRMCGNQTLILLIPATAVPTLVPRASERESPERLYCSESESERRLQNPHFVSTCVCVKRKSERLRCVISPNLLSLYVSLFHPHHDASIFPSFHVHVLSLIPSWVFVPHRKPFSPFSIQFSLSDRFPND